MIKKLIGKFTDNNDSKLSKIYPIIEKINSFESEFEKLSTDEIKEKTSKWQKDLRKENLSDEDKKKYLDKILPEAYALVRESAKRTMNQRHRDVQLIAGVILHQGKVAEQKTGEGKTLTATLPLYLNSLLGNGAHLVTPNDYLSKHGVGWYGPVYDMLGVTAGVIVHDEAYVYDSSYTNENSIDTYSTHLKKSTRKEAYKCDITYGTNSEFGFDYLRDNMADSVERMVQICPIGEYGVHKFAIVDEVDNILIDIARTPLIISSAKNVQPQMYGKFAELAGSLVQDTDYDIDEKDKVVTLTELGISKVERKLGVSNLYEKDFETVHNIENALKAKALFEKDKDYVVKDNQIIIVDQNTGRLLIGNRWSNGLHQAVEAKEGVTVQPESKTVATISYQNYFRLYEKLAGMTGTAMTEADELFKIYSLDVVAVPTYKPIQRIDNPDIVYKTESGKYRAIAKDIAERYKKGQPVLIGTVSVGNSQRLSDFLKRLKIPHEILNAKNHDREALIIAQAGKKGAVTVSTNMAGRGVDIILGGDPFDEEKYNEVVELGGLYVIGTERHDSRRIDNQLRGRSGRQGDIGESRFYLSLQDYLLRIFGGERIESIMNRLGLDENQPIEASIIAKSIENAQKKVEGLNFDQRRSVVQYDDVMNVQRETIYSMRRRILFAEQKESATFFEWIQTKLQPHLGEQTQTIWDSKIKKYGEEIWFSVLKQLSLDVIDILWMDHIDTMDDLKDGVRLRGYGQVDPLIEYKREGKILFEKLLTETWFTISERVQKVEVQVLNKNISQNQAQITAQNNISDPKVQNTNGDTINKLIPNSNKIDYQQGEFESGFEDETKNLNSQINQNNQNNLNYNSETQTPKPVVKADKPGRNDPCWCGSGKKYKKCHMNTD